MNLQRTCVAVALAGLMAGCGSSSDNNNPATAFSLTIAHINDTHSNFDPINSSFANPSLRDGQAVYNQFGGHPRLLSAVNDIKESAERQDQSLLFLHGGDAWQGTGYFKLNNGRMNADILSRMGLDAMAVGNHEFDLDNATLAEFINNVTFPVLGANMDVSQDANLAEVSNLKPYAIYAFDGNEKTRLTDLTNLPKDKQLVAVLGVVLQDMPTISPNVGDVTFQNEIETAQAAVNELKALGVNKIVALTHLGTSRDIALAEGVDGIDVIVGGHSHSLLGDFSNLGMAESDVQYAQLVQTPNGGITCVVQAGQYAQAVGQAQVEFDAQGAVKQCGGGNTLLSSETFYAESQRAESDRLVGAAHAEVENFIAAQDNIRIQAEDPSLRTHIDTYYKPALDEAYGEVIAQVPQTLLHERRPGDNGIDEHGSRVAPIVAEGQLYWANLPEVVALTGMEVDLALVGAGGVRTNIDEGAYYEGNVALELLPFSNYLSVLELTGAEIRQLLNETITLALPDSAHMGKFPYIGGARYLFKETDAQVSGHIDTLELRTGTEADPQWAALEDSRTYNVVMTNYNANGNDDWTALYDAQAESAKRFDIILVNGEPAVYPVEKVVFDGSGYSAVYADGAPDCDQAGAECNTDALSVIEYIRDARTELVEMAYPPVTLQRAQ
ncbi:bifunctional metallophosphatase/5'-nucleotidase [Ferrimonas balearica]|uniref:bifunctional metallophosphatase/5'-nucleotidase n=1 Tax=Ferrimonas balearica TaxID=44012 RepID=UPI001C99D587|nr:bifunctional metallophosphatase/5'-nucleotidase [Ferrimonas balearica]MBY5921915.1 bifunctional metallophosphatase/5'-nucleotidase [Ferrimonas balearica]MBY5994745.1 bifunctional metallophosphatase/5'-nucleotidase [Ferrimonas balearica]